MKRVLGLRQVRATNGTAAALAAETSRRSWAWASYCMNDDGAPRNVRGVSEAIWRSERYFGVAGLVDVTPGVGAGGGRTWFTVTMGTVGDTLTMMGVEPKVWVY
jgi:hypothetical protein